MTVPETATILVVDDSPVNLQVLVRTLQASGHRILAARSGPAALDIAAFPFRHAPATLYPLTK